METAPSPILHLRDLIEETTASRVATIKYRKKSFELRYRILTDDEMAAVNKLVEIPAPRLPSAKDGSPIYDTENPEYREQMRRGYRDRRAAIFIAGVQNFPIPEEHNTLQQKTDWIEKTLPKNIYDAIVNRIEAESTDEVEVLELANFTSSDRSDSPAS